ncbi:MAG TPA: phosphatidylglycerophosphatase A [Burkholderiaceae bacterium]|nr:phosphatidylglycerophosphatase A [Burkholderiaceae bacterium]
MSDRSTTSADSARVVAEPVPDRVWRTPSFAFMRPRLSRWIALGFGSGLAPAAPGTAGTLWAWAAFLALDPVLSDAGWWLAIAAGFAIGVWACGRTGRDLGVSDHSGMVWDEVIAFWAVLLLVPAGWVSQLVAFLLFRAFDVLKPPPIRQVDRRLKGGFGVMADDAIAAFYTVLVIALWVAVFG